MLRVSYDGSNSSRLFRDNIDSCRNKKGGVYTLSYCIVQKFDRYEDIELKLFGSRISSGLSLFTCVFYVSHFPLMNWCNSCSVSRESAMLDDVVRFCCMQFVVQMMRID